MLKTEGFVKVTPNMQKPIANEGRPIRQTNLQQPGGPTIQKKIQKFSYTLTHILPKRGKELIQYLSSISEKSNEIKGYLNSVEVLFHDRR